MRNLHTLDKSLTSTIYTDKSLKQRTSSHITLSLDQLHLNFPLAHVTMWNNPTGQGISHDQWMTHEQVEIQNSKFNQRFFFRASYSLVIPIVSITYKQQVIPTRTTVPLRGSITLIFLSLHVVAIRLPLVFQSMLNIRSGWQSISMVASAVSKFQITIKGSKLALRRMLDATGCQRIWCTFRWWEPSKVNRGSSRIVLPSPSSGICQIFTVVSSDEEAIMLSSKGFQATSRTSCLCPPTRPWSGSRRPTYR